VERNSLVDSVEMWCSKYERDGCDGYDEMFGNCQRGERFVMMLCGFLRNNNAALSTLGLSKLNTCNPQHPHTYDYAPHCHGPWSVVWQVTKHLHLQFPTLSVSTLCLQIAKHLHVKMLLTLLR
jgi:hypothetical protein